LKVLDEKQIAKTVSGAKAQRVPSSERKIVFFAFFASWRDNIFVTTVPARAETGRTSLAHG
jgi:hypothetical protein